MQIVFWGTQPWQSGIVGNMIGIAYMMTQLYGNRSLLMQTRFSCSDLDYALFSESKSQYVKEEGMYFQEIGLDAVLNDAILKLQRKERFPNHVMEVKKDKIYYLPGTYKNNREVYEHHLLGHLEQVLEVAEHFGENLFLDCSGESGKICHKLMEMADVIVVNVPQNPRQVAELPSVLSQNGCKTEYADKTFYLIGQYNDKSKHHLNNLRRKNHIPKEKITAIPYNLEFDDALSEGRALQYLEQNSDTRKEDFNHNFMHELKVAAELIQKKAGQRNAVRKVSI